MLQIIIFLLISHWLTTNNVTWLEVTPPEPSLVMDEDTSRDCLGRIEKGIGSQTLQLVTNDQLMS